MNISKLNRESGWYRWIEEGVGVLPKNFSYHNISVIKKNLVAPIFKGKELQISIKSQEKITSQHI